MDKSYLKKLKGINENIIVRETNEEPESDVIKLLDDKRTFLKAKVLSVGDKVNNLKEGDEIIISSLCETIDSDDEGLRYFCMVEDDVYCRVK